MTDRITTGPSGWAEVPDQPSMRTDLLVLRPVSVNDAEALAPIRNQASVMKGLNRANLVTVDSLRATLQIVIKQTAMGLSFAWTTILPAGRVIGLVQFDKVNPFDKSGSLTVWIDEGLRGKGYGTDACERIIRWGFEDLGLERVDGLVAADNEVSRAMMVSLGFVSHAPVEATNLLGEKTQVLWYILTKGAWHARQSATPSAGTGAPSGQSGGVTLPKGLP